MNTLTGPPIVAIPARNEADRIGACLRALAQQQGVPAVRALLLVNNTDDGTAEVARSAAVEFGLALEVVEHAFPPEQRSAGHARRLAMELAAARVGPDGVVLSTDADGRAAPDWLATNLAHIAAGLDAVAGVAEIDEHDAALIPEALHRADAAECGYAAVLDEIDSLIDPDVDDPWPRHTQHSGASICLTVRALAAAGGVPAVPLGEDRALFAALRRVDARIRHAPEVRVTVSGRLIGRAAGGMADTIRRRIGRPDPTLDDALEPAATWTRRADARAMLRTAYRARDRAGLRRRMAGLGCAPGLADGLIDGPFGVLWDTVEACVPGLVRRPVPVAALPVEMTAALMIRAALIQEPLPIAASEAEERLDRFIEYREQVRR